MAWDNDLIGTHKEIAASTARRISVLAGPGTGKTTYGLMRRVQRLLEEGTDPSSILLISFTRTAANDLKGKLRGIGVDGADQVNASTLHSFCLKLLQEDEVFRSSGRTPRLLLDHEAVHLLHDLSPEFGRYDDRRRRLNELLAGWDTGDNTHPGLAELPEDRAFERELRSWMLHHDAMLIGEVVPLAYQHLQTDPLNEVFDRYTHILVDEYQDLNRLEQHLLELLSKKSETSLFVVGDDDQSIYGFRHAHPEGILDFHAQDETERYALSVCGRCPTQVIGMANNLIAHAPNRDKEPLKPQNNSGDGSVAIVQWGSLEEEIQGIRDSIVGDVRSGRFKPGEILILCNRQEIGRLFRSRLETAGIEAHSFYSQEPLRPRAAQAAFSLLQLVVNEDKAAFRVALGAGADDRRSKAYSRLRKDAEVLEVSERELLQRIVDGAYSPSSRYPSLVTKYKEIIERIAYLKTLQVPDLERELVGSNNNSLESLRELLSEHATIAESAEELLKLVSERISLLEVPEHPNYVRVMSLHKSKGLTAKCVYVTTALDQVIPYFKSSFSGTEIERALDDGRRLMYVAITRAAEKLVISFPRKIPSDLAQSWGIDVGGSPRRGAVTMNASSYIHEFGTEAPGVVAGNEWLASILEKPLDDLANDEG